ncbi:Pinin-like protein [Sarcoptes scabiei]|uniref:Pinin-like protein n=1 Tax=Sarcoptes scabiei TaxID=52283 RepID=A0A132AKT8_SARSC|nr:Pinin-like protein [Sarcoptes scabiei]
MSKPIADFFLDLESEYNCIQKSLIDINDNIKKITGKEIRYNDNDEVDDYSDDEGITSKKSLQSQVVTTLQEPKERDQVLKEQKDDKKLLSRNKRMLGHLMGTLEKFRSEESKRKDVQKRVEIEERLDQAAEEEREAVKKEQEKLYQERQLKMKKMKCLEQKLQIAEIHQEWEKSQQFKKDFIETKNKPNIFWMPVQHNTETLKRLQETKDKYRIVIAEKRAKVLKELSDIDDLFQLKQNEKVDDAQKNNQENEKNGHEISMIENFSNQTNNIATNDDRHLPIDNHQNEKIPSNEQNKENHRHSDHKHRHHSSHHRHSSPGSHKNPTKKIEDSDCLPSEESKVKDQDRTMEEFEPIYD